MRANEIRQLLLALEICTMAGALAQVPDRTILPIHPPQILHSTVLDVRNATAPPRFDVKTPDGEPGLNYLCAGLKKFYAKATSDRGELARRLAL